MRASATPDELRALIRAELRLDGSAFTAALAEARFGRPGEQRGGSARARTELRALLRVIRRNLGLARAGARPRRPPLALDVIRLS